jgi:hypothetical protein
MCVNILENFVPFGELAENIARIRDSEDRDSEDRGKDGRHDDNPKTEVADPADRLAAAAASAADVPTIIEERTAPQHAPGS